MSARRFVRLEDLLGRRVIDAEGAVVGRIGEVRAQPRGDVHEVTEYLLGSGALLERLSIVGRLLGRRTRAIVVRWDQIDISRPEAPRLTCTVGELKVERPHG